VPRMGYGPSQTKMVDVSASQADVGHGARTPHEGGTGSPACLPCARFCGVCPLWRGILAGWDRGVGLRADPLTRRRATRRYQTMTTYR